MKNNLNGQSAAKLLKTVEMIDQEERSTTISQESTEVKLGKQPVYLKKRNVIYKIVNSCNGKIYIGSASYYDKRLGTHINLLRKNSHKNPHLQNAYNKHGENCFRFEILEKVENRQDLIKREQFWLDEYKSYYPKIGYNISKIAGSNLGNKLSEETKMKISKFQKGKPKSEEHIKKFKEVQTAMNGKRIIVYDKEMNFIKEFPSISECSRELKVSVSSISKQCSKNSGEKKRKDSKYIFRYKDIV